jgi:hypothetical protein
MKGDVVLVNNEVDSVWLFLDTLRALISVYDEDNDSIPINKLKSLLEHYGLHK